MKENRDIYLLNGTFMFYSLLHKAFHFLTWKD